MAAVIRPRFYPHIALALGVLVLVGFARTFYLRQWFDVPPIAALLYLHGFVFTAWFALFITQTRLIAANNIRLHQKLGIAGVVFAVIVVVTSLATTIVSAAAPRLRPMGMNSQQFSFIPFIAAVGFAALFAAAVRFRRKPQLHRRLMMLAMFTLLGPPVARIVLQYGDPGRFLLVQTLVTALLILVCLINDWVKYRTVHPIYSIGGLILVASWPARAAIARTEAWEQVGRWMASLTT